MAQNIEQDTLAVLSGETNTANSAISLSEDRSAIVELDPDHPGFRDQLYRARRNSFAQLAVDFVPGGIPPDAPYEEQDQLVWRAVWDSLAGRHQEHACAEYLTCMDQLAMPKGRIPQLAEVSDQVHSMSGYRLEPVGGLVDPQVFLSVLAKGVFLSTQYIRHSSTPLYTPEPDVVHELIGHAAMLASPNFTKLTRMIGEATKRVRTPRDLERISRVYWYTIEFGVLNESAGLRAYGAGLLSSAGELAAMHQAELRPFDLNDMENRDYDVTQFQPVLYCADSFEEMNRKMEHYLETFPG